MKTVFNKEKNLDATKQPMFFGDDLAVQRYDTFKYPLFDKFPLSAFVWKKDIKQEEQLSLGVISLWDGFSYDIQVWSKRLLKNCDVQINHRQKT